MRINTDVLGFSDIPACHDSPASSSVDGSKGTVQGRRIEDSRVAGIERDCGNGRVIEADVAPFSGWLESVQSAGCNDF